ncbi:MAG: gliding motility lipoprotein GldD [Bacteroidetes bacterium]|nr:MAG: gliding motility lipoprotein GldD [Bacteroidota bacterium]
MQNKFIYSFLCVIFLCTCNRQEGDGFTPKPRGYHRLEIPKHEYVNLPDTLPYTFEYSKHAQISADTSFMAEKFWLEVYYPQFTANLDISYKKIKGKTEFRDYVNDSHRLADKHNIKAYSIQETVIKTPKGYHAIVFELEGDVPSQFQFYVTDSIENFLRVDLYFPTSIKNDSLAPIIEHIKYDMMQMLNTVEWNKKVKAEYVPPKNFKKPSKSN